ncbi:MAG: hypothetical protein WC707_00750 [Candidatus Babeliaceae bacterium]|jgi:hypothetical protein
MLKKRIFSTIVLYSLSLYSFTLQGSWQGSWQDFWSSLWNKKQTEIITKEYDINPSATITIEVYGNVTLKPFKQKKLFIEMQGSYDELNDTALHTEIKSSHVIVSTRSKSDVETMLDYTFLVPTGATVNLVTKKGLITLNGTEGILSVITENGDIFINNGISTITAKAPHGKISAQQKKLPSTASLFLEAGKGITLYLDRTINANLHAKTLHGAIESTLNVTLNPIKTLLNKTAWKNVMRDLKATFGNGGAPITLDVVKGNIKIEELV